MLKCVPHKLQILAIVKTPGNNPVHYNKFMTLSMLYGPGMEDIKHICIKIVLFFPFWKYFIMLWVCCGNCIYTLAYIIRLGNILYDWEIYHTTGKYIIRLGNSQEYITSESHRHILYDCDKNAQKITLTRGSQRPRCFV